MRTFVRKNSESIRNQALTHADDFIDLIAKLLVEGNNGSIG